MIRLSPSSLFAMTALLLVFFLSGCSEDEPMPRVPGDQTAPFGSSSGSKTKPDADDEDTDEGDIEEPGGCALEPRQALDDQVQPCCFTDADCQSSGAVDAHLMRCYGAICTQNGEGICRVPPTAPGSCWTRSDCEEGQLCRDAFIGTCEQPQLGLEFEGVCL